jgi:hypothetical protein
LFTNLPLLTGISNVFSEIWAVESTDHVFS